MTVSFVAAISLPPLSIASKEATTRWEECWKTLTSLQTTAASREELYEMAAAQVRSCCTRCGNKGFSWFEWQVMDGQLFVSEQLAKDPETEMDPENETVG